MTDSASLLLGKSSAKVATDAEFVLLALHRSCPFSSSLFYAENVYCDRNELRWKAETVHFNCLFCMAIERVGRICSKWWHVLLLRRSK